MALKREVADKQLNGDLMEIAKTLRSKFEVKQKDERTWKEENKQPVKKEEIFIIVKPQNRARHRSENNSIVALPGNTLHISF